PNQTTCTFANIGVSAVVHLRKLVHSWRKAKMIWTEGESGRKGKIPKGALKVSWPGSKIEDDCGLRRGFPDLNPVKTKTGPAFVFGEPARPPTPRTTQWPPGC